MALSGANDSSIIQTNEPFVEPNMTPEEQISQCIVHATEPIENIPPLLSQELASIGRAVAFVCETTVGSSTEFLVYEGLISMVTADCITLLHTMRFTKEEFEAHRAAINQHEEFQPKDDAFHNMEYHASDGSVAMISSNPVPDAAVAHPFTAPSVIPDADFHKVREKCSMGPIPCMTFSRRNIYDVHFSLNPPSSFYSLFADPEKRLRDMQYLRMFVRRYLVHTSQGNNPGGIPLKAFILCRCNCSSVTDTLLETVGTEEVANLTHADAKMNHERSRSHRRRGDLGMIDGEDPLRLMLISTGITRITTAIAMLIGCLSVFTLAFALLFIYGLGLPRLLYLYINKTWQFFFMGGWLCIPVALLGWYHASVMSPPLISQFYYTLPRAIVSCLALAICVFSVVKLVSRATPSTLANYYYTEAADSDKCALFDQYQCSGWTSPDLELIVGKCGQTTYYAVSCKAVAVMKINTILVPIIAAYIILSMFLLADLASMGAMYYYIRKIDQHVARFR